ncbi:MAG: ABC-2 family transporter protein [Planctomycetota bacterium]|nr:ABC-2 family transporter protein [Planctomycetota bacterium]MCX8040767.1 ABC-2 family transporter protein [Planctomycetota bacterium]
MRIALLFVITYLKRRLAYRGDLLVQMLDELLRGLIALAMLQVYASKTDRLAGYSPDALLFVLGFSLVPISLFHCLCGNLYQFNARYILDGNLDRILLRPYPVFWQVCFDRLAIEDLSGTILGCALMAIAALRMPDFAWTPLHLAGLAVMLLSSTMVVIGVFKSFAALGFWFDDRVGMMPPVYNLMEFGRWPTELYAPWLKLFITCVIPFAFAGFLPASVFVGGESWPLLASPVVGVAALAVGSLLWRLGLARYNSTGS